MLENIVQDSKKEYVMDALVSGISSTIIFSAIVSITFSSNPISDTTTLTVYLIIFLFLLPIMGLFIEALKNIAKCNEDMKRNDKISTAQSKAPLTEYTNDCSNPNTSC